VALSTLRETRVTTLHGLRDPIPESMVAAGVQPDSKQLVADLFEKYHAAIFAYLYRVVGERELAHDLCQETFLRVLRAHGRLRRVDNQRAWVYRIATNVAFNDLKRRRRFAWLPWRNIDGVAAPIPDPGEQTDQRVAVERVLARLPMRYRAPLLLYSHYGFSVREVAEVLEISEGAVKTRLHRAREAFRRLYEEVEGT
jgi:RNA polymerase sigma-70 factor (ECF subfamily)